MSAIDGEIVAGVLARVVQSAIRDALPLIVRDAVCSIIRSRDG